MAGQALLDDDGNKENKDYKSTINTKIDGINKDLNVYIDSQNKEALTEINKQADKGATDQEFKHTQQMSDNMDRYVDFVTKEPKQISDNTEQDVDVVTKQNDSCWDRFIACVCCKK